MHEDGEEEMGAAKICETFPPYEVVGGITLTWCIMFGWFLKTIDQKYVTAGRTQLSR